MQKKLIILLLMIFPFIFNSCASMFSGRASWLNVETAPENVQVKIYEIETGITFTKTAPFKMELSKKSDYKLEIESPNYKSEDIIIRRSLAGWFWANILVGILGFGVDAVTGNMWKHNQHLVKFNLDSLEEAPEKVTINIPITFFKKDGSEFVKYMPIKFTKKHIAKDI